MWIFQEKSSLKMWNWDTGKLPSSRSTLLFSNLNAKVKDPDERSARHQSIWCPFSGAALAVNALVLSPGWGAGKPLPLSDWAP